MTSDALTIERRDQVMVLHLDDGKANALSFDLIAALMAALAEAEADDGVGAVVIHGREGKFSGGFDLGVMLADDFSAPLSLPFLCFRRPFLFHFYAFGAVIVCRKT